MNAQAEPEHHRAEKHHNAKKDQQTPQLAPLVAVPQDFSYERGRWRDDSQVV